jgi:DNA-binding PadR family transcriptional regulator
MTRGKRSAEALLPLSAPMFQVLIALADGDKHGYAIIKEVTRRTQGEVKLGAGTLYAIIRKFEGDGVVEECDERPDPALDDERRRYYRLTAFGREVAQAEGKRMEDALRMAQAKNLIPRTRLI